MSAAYLVFCREAELLHILTAQGPTAWLAANNAASTSRGPWPEGVFVPEMLVPVSEEPDGAYGSFFLRYRVSGRTGMGIHAGRANNEDKAGRSGPRHATMGCIRTSDAAMTKIVEAITMARGKLPLLWVVP